jgi:hypothetical protein
MRNIREIRSTLYFYKRTWRYNPNPRKAVFYYSYFTKCVRWFTIDNPEILPPSMRRIEVTFAPDMHCGQKAREIMLALRGPV